jgi:hypothetical protein
MKDYRLKMMMVMNSFTEEVGLVVAVLWVMGKGSIKFLHFSFFHNLF